MGGFNNAGSSAWWAVVRLRVGRFIAASTWRRWRWRASYRLRRIHDLTSLIPVVGLGVLVVFYSVASYVAWYARARFASGQAAEAASYYLSTMLERMQRAYFIHPWFSALSISLLEHCGSVASLTIRAGLRTHLALLATPPKDMGKRRYLSRIYWKVPRDGYQAAMGVWLGLGEAAGYFRGRSVRVLPVNVNGKMAKPQERENLPLPTLTRWNAPLTLEDALVDIDDIYWNSITGMPVKIIRVGDTHTKATRRFVQTVNKLVGHKCRWIVILTGTDHLTMASTLNPADSQTNLMECINEKSLVRQGVDMALRDAFGKCGLHTDEQLASEDIMIVGHSQGAMIGMAMAADPTLPYTIKAVVSAGGPIGRMPVPPHTTVLALRHRQDCIPAFGGFTGEDDPRICVFERSLAMPDSGVLYYAHAASTYAETAKLAEEMYAGMPETKLGHAINVINTMFPQAVGGSVDLKLRRIPLIKNVWARVSGDEAANTNQVAKGALNAENTTQKLLNKGLVIETSRVFVYELIQDLTPETAQGHILEPILTRDLTHNTARKENR